jgi:hypothetical protein
LLGGLLTPLTGILIPVVMILNFAISWYNARAVGSMWPEIKAMGGWYRLVAYAGAVMSACGFTWGIYDCNRFYPICDRKARW